MANGDEGIKGTTAVSVYLGVAIVLVPLLHSHYQARLEDRIRLRDLEARVEKIERWVILKQALDSEAEKWKGRESLPTLKPSG